ncbi:MAG: radical SAM protein [Desulfobacterota bacterium]|nr:radical SAM protein [Thermodesulfobacteriota bacterium]
MKIALIQLPLQSHDYVYSLENIPLAAGCLAAYLEARKAPAEVVVCPGAVMNLGGDAAVMQWLEEQAPDVVGFSCYLWNVERTLYLCSLVRQRMAGCTIVLGGPEVTADNDFLLEHGTFHFGVTGEGEQGFYELICGLAAGRDDFRDTKGLILPGGTGAVFTGLANQMADLEALPSPYLAGILSPSLRGSVLMETVRGCPMRCTYCYYHKSAPSVRAFSVERIVSEVAWAGGNGVAELTVIDPCFARRPGIEALLSAIAAGRGKLQRFSCELNAEDLTPALVDALVEAGLAHVEVGLQSTNQKALRNIGRRFRREAFMAGVRMLRSAGVRVMTDVMVGLPGDSLDDVKRSIDFVLTEDLCDDLSVYPLSVLPGTVLRAQAARFGIGRLQEPPYLVTCSNDMDRDDIREAFAYAQEVSGRDFFPVEMPRPGEEGPEGRRALVSRVIFDDQGRGGAVEPPMIGQALCIEARSLIPGRGLERIGTALHDALAGNPFTLLSIILPEEAFRGEETLGFLTAASGRAPHPADREYMSAFTPERSIQLFLKGATSSGGSAYTQVPLRGDPARPVWAALPPDAGREEEDLHRERMANVLGYSPEIRFHDSEEKQRDALDGLLGTRVL